VLSTLSASLFVVKAVESGLLLVDFQAFSFLTLPWAIHLQHKQLWKLEEKEFFVFEAAVATGVEAAN